MWSIIRSRKGYIRTLSFLLLFPLASASALTLSQIRTELRVRIRDTSTTRQRYSDSQLLNLINEAQRDVVNETWAVEKTTTDFSLSVNTTYYAFPTDMIAPFNLTSNGMALPETSLIQLDSLNQGNAWIHQTGVPQYYFVDRSKGLGFFPVPGTVTSTTTISYHYYAMAPDLAADSDVPFNGQSNLLAYDDLLIYYPAAVIYTIENEADKSKDYFSLYTARLQLMEQDVGKRPNFVPSMAGPANSR